MRSVQFVAAVITTAKTMKKANWEYKDYLQFFQEEEQDAIEEILFELGSIRDKFVLFNKYSSDGEYQRIWTD